VPEKPIRRRFSAEYKQRILREAEACTKPGELGGLLRREALYSSHLAAWRPLRGTGGRRGSSPKTWSEAESPGGKADRKRIDELERENRRLKARVERAEALVDLPKTKWRRCLAGR